MMVDEPSWDGAIDATAWTAIVMFAAVAALTSCIWVAAPLVILVPAALYSLFLYGYDWITAGTIKAGTHDPDNPMCACGTCEAIGRWLKRPLRVPPHNPEPTKAWISTIGSDILTQEEEWLIENYLAGQRDTREFLSAFQAVQPIDADVVLQRGTRSFQEHEQAMPPLKCGCESRGSCFDQGTRAYDPEVVTSDTHSLQSSFQALQHDDNRVEIHAIRCALEHDYRVRHRAMPPLKTRMRMARQMFDQGTRAYWYYDPDTKEGHYSL